MTTTLERPTAGTRVATDRRRLSPPSPRHVALVVAVAVYAWMCWRFRGFVTDDAWISVRYAENLADGHGFVWNPGGPRAEGYSNPLLVGVEAVADLAGFSAMTAARGLGVLSGLALLLVVHVRGPLVVGRLGATAATLFIAFSAPMAVWSVGGLETIPVALLLTVGVLELARADGGRPWVAAGAMALLPWLRPEGLLAVVVLVVLSEGRGLLRRPDRRAGLRRLAVLGGVPVLSQVLVEVFRLTVYGHLVPNSVLFKAGRGELFGVAEKFLSEGAVVLVLALVGLVAARGRQRLLAVAPAVYLLGSLDMLDNVNTFSRFFLPVWPPLALLAGLGVAALLAGTAEHRSRVAAAVVTGATALGMLTLSPADLHAAEHFVDTYRDCKTTSRSAMADWLRTTPQDTTFAIVDAGLVPARAGGRTAIESLFLNEASIQETGALPTDQQVAEILRREPDLIVVASTRADVFVPAYEVDAALLADPAGAAYRQVFVASGGVACDYHLFVYQR
ncbi:hypothetical protein [Blastococcus sp. SYSU D00813]